MFNFCCQQLMRRFERWRVGRKCGAHINDLRCGKEIVAWHCKVMLTAQGTCFNALRRTGWIVSRVEPVIRSATNCRQIVGLDNCKWAAIWMLKYLRDQAQL